jgi:hypothetical protein
VININIFELIQCFLALSVSEYEFLFLLLLIRLLIIILIIVVSLPVIILAALIFMPLLVTLSNNKIHMELPLEPVSVETSQNFVSFLMYVVNTEPVNFGSRSQGLSRATPGIISCVFIRYELCEVVYTVDVDVKGIFSVDLVV